ncbi:kinase [Dokdonella sp.]|uniref:kinase n=1 Tax=Dokdonella sp. TaxID=2291710 RepID=UPI003C4D242F
MSGNASTRRGFAPQVITQLLDTLFATLPSDGANMVLGLSALQGSGKTTLAAQLACASKARGLDAIALSLDDFYLGRRDRSKLARLIHPLLRTRGVPGTHDVALLESVLDALRTARDNPFPRVPRFDKGRDTRLPPSRWRAIRQPPHLIILEGWCVGLGAEDRNSLGRPINALESSEDSDGRWRRWVNRQLAGNYCRLWQKLDRLLVLQAPGFDVVQGWRDEQEQVLRARGARQAMPAHAISRFVAHTERLSQHALNSLPARADVLVRLGTRREVRSISAPVRPVA